ncbi:hypothetical protein K3495_g7548 [Podosphaera aphanis]|nr:hypothetical protein K3495_g7548 [Podosphaera aphanis]
MRRSFHPRFNRSSFLFQPRDLYVITQTHRRYPNTVEFSSTSKQAYPAEDFGFHGQDYYISFQSRKVKEVLKDAIKLPSIDHSFNKMKCWAQIISTPTVDTPGTTILLHFDNKRYLIGNVAEGTQRAAAQRRFGLIKVNNIFLTGSVCWGSAGGLLGMILTLADVKTVSLEERKASNKTKPNRINLVEKMEKLTIHGGRNLTHLLATSRRFVFRKGIPLETNEFKAKKESGDNGWEPSWRDENIKVWVMVIEPEGETLNTRKRSYDDFNDKVPVGADESPEEQESRYNMIRKSVLSSMFDSNWRLDTLVKKKLSEVQLPAKIFYRNKAGKIEDYTGPTVEEDQSVADLEVFIRNPWPGALIESLPPTVPSKSSTCYIFKNYAQRGKFDPVKAKELGVLPGPDFGRLTKGESIVTPSGKTITPEMVLGKGKDGGGFAVVELPTKGHIEPLLSRKEWSSDEVMLGVGIVVWILGAGVINDPRLQSFMQERKELKHIISSQDCCPNYIALESPAAAAIHLNILDPAHFPLPDFSNQINGDETQGHEIYEPAKCGMTLQLEPFLEVQRETIVPLLNTSKVALGTPGEVTSMANEVRKKLSDPKYLAILAKNQDNIPSKDAEVTTLGTGSSLPSKYRNVISTLVRVPGYGNYLLDCGENTLGQMKRVFGAELPDILLNLKAIWISHLHADHHLGTVTVVKAWHELTMTHETSRESKLVVASDNGMINWLREYAEVENYGFERIEPIIFNRKVGYRFDANAEQISRMGFSLIQACPVEHCAGALAVVISFPNGFKVAYSGDCRPSRQFVTIGQGTTLLIHEATFDDELRGDAIAKKHSTTSEALDIGNRMNARRILLTHFSQRYQKIPIMNCNDGKAPVAIVAFDYMKIKVEDFVHMEAFKPALIRLYELKDEM